MERGFRGEVNTAHIRIKFLICINVPARVKKVR
jgi:hypothetical protein